jgi:fructose/tagatose bisphosphate aldolase
VTVEAELGPIVGDEDRADRRAATALTDPADAARFAAETGVDALAVAVGNVHGFYAGEPWLDGERLAEIARGVAAPLVIHGTSGLPDAAIREAIGYGVAKFNLNTELRVAFVEALAAGLPDALISYDLPRFFQPGMDAMQAVVERKLALFGAAGRAPA